MAKTILLVDNNPDVLITSQALLQHKGYNVMTASSAEAALALPSADKAAIDLLLTDYELGRNVKNGIELIGEMRHGGFRPPAILAFGNSNQAVLKAQAAAYSDVVFFPKQEGPKALLSLVARQLCEPALLFEHDTNDSDYYRRIINADLKRIYEAAPHKPAREETEERLMHWASQLANANVHLGKGGPFGALIVDFNTPSGIPDVAGVGANHVVPNNDPSAHAEMTAIRDTAKRLKRSDLSGLTLITSCECCPMCLSGTLASGIKELRYNRTRKNAADIDFIDEAQYEAMRGGLAAQARQAETSAEKLLNGHDAVVLVGGKAFYGDNQVAASNDPTAIAGVQAVQQACKELELFHLPPGTQLITRLKPHPMTLVAADWADIGREAVAGDAKQPARKNPDAITYLDAGRWESLYNGTRPEMAAPIIIEHINLPDDQRQGIFSRRIGEGVPPVKDHAGEIAEARGGSAFTEWARRLAEPNKENGAVKY